ncbi:MAG TPA: FRG domain-containing protein [Candidatus Babeliaceae bacterium]|nr:FRG domain-containing protein [Candidatus Babeliaceae bacterium]
MQINNTASFYKFLEIYAEDSTARIYRGVSSDRYKLIPSIGRKKFKDGTRSLTEKDEDLIFRHFKQRSKRFLHKNYDDMNLLAIAQHHGLPTRLLDWTFNPLAAVYFAVEHEIVQPSAKNNQTKNSVIYIYDKQFNAIINKDYETIKVDKLEFFVPDFNDDRIINQNGLFTVHPYPWTELSDERIKIVTIDLKFRRELRKILNRLGINQSTIYPDLDGLASHISWMRTFDY